MRRESSVTLALSPESHVTVMNFARVHPLLKRFNSSIASKKSPKTEYDAIIVGGGRLINSLLDHINNFLVILIHFPLLVCL